MTRILTLCFLLLLASPALAGPRGDDLRALAGAVDALEADNAAKTSENTALKAKQLEDAAVIAAQAAAIKELEQKLADATKPPEPPPPPPPQNSPEGTKATPGAGSIVLNGTTWTVTSGKQIAVNGVTDTNTGNVDYILLWKSEIYQTAWGKWWKWTPGQGYNGWTETSDPTAPPPSTPTLSHAWLNGLRGGLSLPAGRTTFTDAEIARLKADGVTHIVVETNFGSGIPATKPVISQQTAQIAFIDKLAAQGIKVQFRIRFYSSDGNDASKYPAYMPELFGDLCGLIQSKWSPAQVSAMGPNEPARGASPAAWLTQVKSYEQACHAKAPGHLFFFMPMGWDWLTNLEAAPPTGFGANTGIEIHEYDPMPYTHQGQGAEFPAAGTRSVSQAELDALKSNAARFKAVLTRAGLVGYVGETGAVRLAPNRQAYHAASVAAYRAIGVPIAIWIDDPASGEGLTGFDGLVLEGAIRVVRPEVKAGLSAWPAPKAALNVTCDGISDQRAQLQQAFDAAKAQGVSVRVTGTCRYGNTLSADSITVYGDGPGKTGLKAIDPANSSVFGRGKAVAFYNLTLDGSGSKRIEGSDNRNCFVFNGVDGFTVENVHVLKCSGVGLASSGSKNGVIRRNRFEHTYADSMHITGSSEDILIEGNETYLSGDDSVGSVSYGSQVNRRIRVLRNYFHDSRSGRGVAVLGGTDIEVTGNYIADMHYAGDMAALGGLAGLYIGTEKPDPYDPGPLGPTLIKDNIVINSGGSLTGHAAILLLNQQGGKNYTVGPLTLTGNIVVNPAKFGYVPDGNGKILAAIEGTAPVYTDTKTLYQSFNTNAGTFVSGVANIVKRPLSSWADPGKPVAGLDPAFVAPPMR